MIRRLLSLAFLVLASPAYAVDELVIGMNSSPGTLNPFLNSSLAGAFINAMTERPLSAYDANWKLACFVCTELPTVENGRARVVDLPPDDKGVTRKGMEIDIELKPMNWADGTPLTSRDVPVTLDVG